MRFGVWGLGFRIQGSGLRFEGQGLVFRGLPPRRRRALPRKLPSRSHTPAIAHTHILVSQDLGTAAHAPVSLSHTCQRRGSEEGFLDIDEICVGYHRCKGTVPDSAIFFLDDECAHELQQGWTRCGAILAMVRTRVLNALCTLY